MSRAILCLLILCAAVSTASAATYYVSPTGDDGNSGVSESEAFRVVQHAVDQMKSGDMLVVMDGVYAGELKLKLGITLKAKNPRKAIFSGAEPVKAHFERHSGNIYKARISGSPKQLFYNDQPMKWARWPNATWAENWIAEKKWAKATDGTGPGVLTSQAFKRIADMDLAGAYCFLRYGKGNSCYSRLIESFDGTTLNWNDDNFYSSKYTGEDGRKGSPEAMNDPNFAKRSAKFGIHPRNSKFFLAGALSLLDAPGEWFVNDGFLYLYPTDGKDPNGAVILVKTTDFCIDEKEPVSDVTVEGIDFLGCSVRLSSSENENITFENCHFKYSGAELLYIDRVQGWGETDKPIFIAGTNVRIERCLFAGAQNTGLKLRGSDLLVHNSVFMENNRHANFESRALLIENDGTYRITRNTFFNNCSDAIRILKEKGSGVFSEKDSRPLLFLVAVETVRVGMSNGVPQILVDGKPVRARMFWGAPGSRPLSIGPEAKKISFEFSPTEDEPDRATMHFRFGSTPGDVYTWTDGSAAVALRQTSDGWSLFAGPPGLTSELLRVATRKAGVHLFTNTDCNVYANGPYVVLHASQEGPVQVDTGRRGQIMDLLSGEQLGQGPKITLPMELGETRVLVASEAR